MKNVSLMKNVQNLNCLKRFCASKLFCSSFQILMTIAYTKKTSLFSDSCVRKPKTVMFIVKSGVKDTESLKFCLKRFYDRNFLEIWNDCTMLEFSFKSACLCMWYTVVSRKIIMEMENSSHNNKIIFFVI